MTAIRRLRDDINKAHSEGYPTIDWMPIDDARAWLALAEACQAFLVKMNEPDDFVDGAGNDERETVFVALAAITTLDTPP